MFSIFSIGLVILNIVEAILSSILIAAFIVLITTSIFNTASLIDDNVSLALSHLSLMLS